MNVLSEIDSFLIGNEVNRKHSFTKDGNYFSFCFLCGKAKDENGNDNRANLQKNYLEPKNIVLYAEDLYKVLEFDPSIDLLTIENVLLSLCSFVLIILESFGSACELGAFVNNVNGRKKLYVIEDEQHKNDDSFINYGPLNLLIKSPGPEHVIYQTFSSGTMTPDSSLKSRLDPLGDLTQSYPKVPWTVNQNKLIVPDLCFLLSWVFEYVRHFGFLEEGRVHELLRYLVEQGAVWDELEIAMVAGDSIKGDKAQNVLETLPKLLSKVGLFKEKKHNNGHLYYTMSSFGSKLCGDFPGPTTSKRSVVFVKEFLDSKTCRDAIVRIKLHANKEGYELFK